jgi:hypothetical protein
VRHALRTGAGRAADGPCADFRSKFSAIQRECSPSPRKFYGFCTSVTVCAFRACVGVRSADGRTGHVDDVWDHRKRCVRSYAWRAGR